MSKVTDFIEKHFKDAKVTEMRTLVKTTQIEALSTVLKSANIDIMALSGQLTEDQIASIEKLKGDKNDYQNVIIVVKVEDLPILFNVLNDSGLKVAQTAKTKAIMDFYTDNKPKGDLQ